MWSHYYHRSKSSMVCVGQWAVDDRWGGSIRLMTDEVGASDWWPMRWEHPIDDRWDGRSIRLMTDEMGEASDWWPMRWEKHPIDDRWDGSIRLMTDEMGASDWWPMRWEHPIDDRWDGSIRLMTDEMGEASDWWPMRWEHLIVLLYIKEFMMKGHLSCRGTFYGMLRCITWRQDWLYSWPVFKGHSYEGTPVIRGHFLRTVSYLPHVKEPVMRQDWLYRCPIFPMLGNLWWRDTCHVGTPVM